MNRREVSLLKEGAEITPLIGPHAGKKAKVLKIEMDAGAYNGWLTVQFPATPASESFQAMYAGEEIAMAEACGRSAMSAIEKPNFGEVAPPFSGGA